MTDKASQITALLAPTVESLGLELLGAEYLPTPGGAVLRLYIDVPSHITAHDAGQGADGEPRMVGIEDCEAVSREVSAQLDVEDPISSNYTLEVSSPGVDRPLFTPAQFAQFIGQQAKVGLKLPQDGRRKLRGQIIGVDDQKRIEFDVDGHALKVPIDIIDKARLVPDWVALGYGPAKDKTGRDARPGKKQANKKPTKKPTASQPPRAEQEK